MLAGERAHLLERGRDASALSAPATAIQHPLGVGERQAAALRAAPRGGRARRRPPRRRAHRTPRAPRARPPRPPPAPSRRSAPGRRAASPCTSPRAASRARVGDRPLERRQRLVRGGRLELAPVKAGPLAGVAGRAGGLDEREQRVAVAVVAHRLHAPACCPTSRPCARAPCRERLKKCISPVSRVSAQRLGVHVGERQHLAAAPVLHDARDQPALVECDLRVVHADDSRCDGPLSGRAGRRPPAARARQPGSRHGPGARVPPVTGNRARCPGDRSTGS